MPASIADQFDTDMPGIDYLRLARELAPDLAAAADEIERRRELPELLVAALVERGFFRLLLPRSLGGAELLPADFVPVIEEIAKADASTAWCLNQASGCSMTAAYLDPEAACEIFDGPRGILAWGPGPGTARVVEGGYRVTASWSLPAAATTPPGSAAMSRSSKLTGNRASTPMAARSSARCCSRNRIPE
jgi:alkylation response protein AidB-like acyl-CoA dehydrogenase